MCPWCVYVVCFAWVVLIAGFVLVCFGVIASLCVLLFVLHGLCSLFVLCC